MSASINVMIANNRCRLIDISEALVVSDVKAITSKKTGIDVDKFDFLFCGKFLSGETSLKDLCLGESSILHVISSTDTNTEKSDQTSQLKPLLTVQQLEKPDIRHYQYFVYCKECDGLQPGKLRVRCLVCRQGAILLDKEPCNWDDVLLPGRLHGHCAICDKTTIAQFYFKCCQHDGQEESVPLKHIRPNSHCVECVTCTLERSPVIVYPCTDKHVICIDCFISYARVSLDQRSFVEDPDIGYSLLCPVGCEDSLIQETHHFKLLGNDQYERYKDFGAEECLLQSGGILCPNTGCGEGIVIEDNARHVQCRTCRFEFCRQCRQEVHNGPCQLDSSSAEANMALNVDSERAVRARWEARSMETIQETTKPCPHCAVKTERSGGCMHMRCSRCGKDWCWLCEKEWSRGCQGEHWFG